MSGARRVHPGWIAAGALALVLLAALFGHKGLVQLWRLRGELESLHRDVQILEAENERLSRAIAELRDNPSVLERIAREELGLVRPGERVLRFPSTRRHEAVAGPRVPAPARSP